MSGYLNLEEKNERENEKDKNEPKKSEQLARKETMIIPSVKRILWWKKYDN